MSSITPSTYTFNHFLEAWAKGNNVDKNSISPKAIARLKHVYCTKIASQEAGRELGDVLMITGDKAATVKSSAFAKSNKIVAGVVAGLAVIGALIGFRAIKAKNINATQEKERTIAIM